MLSIILPTYNEEGNIENAYHKIKEVLAPKGIQFELVFVMMDRKTEVLRLFVSWQIRLRMQRS